MNTFSKIKLALLRQLNRKICEEYLTWLHEVEARAEEEGLTHDEATFLQGQIETIKEAWELWIRLREEVRQACISTSSSTTPDTSTAKKS